MVFSNNKNASKNKDNKENEEDTMHIDNTLSFNSSIIDDIKNDNYLVIANHIGATDFLLINAINKYNFRHAKYAIKNGLKYFPIFFQGCQLCDFLIINRSFEKDKLNIEKYFRELASSFWFIIYCEGHRMTDKRREESRKFCMERGITPYNNVLCPRYKGFDLIVKTNSRIKNLLDLTFYCENVPTLTDIFLSGKVFDYKCNYRIIPMDEIVDPVTFLTDAFRRKDDIIQDWKDVKQ